MNHPCRANGRRALLLGLGAFGMTGLSGCNTLVPDLPARQWFLLEDLAVATRVEGPTIPHVVLVEPNGTGAFHDSTALTYSRADGARAHYQFAGWTERPSRRVAQLLERRLLARQRLAGVAQSTAGVRGDLLLRVSLEDARHDLTGSPGAAVLVLGLELVDWRQRRLLAREEFRARVRLASDDAAGAAAGLSRAATIALDDACLWVEARAAAATR